jgi:hypothetical protein
LVELRKKVNNLQWDKTYEEVYKYLGYSNVVIFVWR